MTPEIALVELRRAGVRVRLDPAGVLKLDAAKRPPDAVLELVRAHRDGLAALVRAAGSAVRSPASGCTEMGQLPPCLRGRSVQLVHPRALDLPTPARASVPPAPAPALRQITDAPPPACASVLSRTRNGGGLAVPAEWLDGMERLATMPSPARIVSERWSAFVGAAERVLLNHGVELHTAGWTALDLFGLDDTAPETNPAGWGLAWLLGSHGGVLDVAADAVGMRREPAGARLAFRRRARTAWAMPAWTLGR